MLSSEKIKKMAETANRLANITQDILSSIERFPGWKLEGDVIQELVRNRVKESAINLDINNLKDKECYQKVAETMFTLEVNPHLKRSLIIQILFAGGFTTEEISSNLADKKLLNI